MQGGERNEYDDLLESNEYDAQLQQDAGRQALRASMVPALDTNPEQYAEAQRLGKIAKLPAPIVARNLDRVRQRVQVNDYDKLLSDSPALARELSAKPEFAKIAHDDTEALSGVERGLWAIAPPTPSLKTWLAGQWEAFTQGARRTHIGLQLQMHDLDLDFGLPKSEAADEVRRRDLIRQFEQATGRQDAARPGFESATAEGIYSGVESFTQALPGLAASIATRSPAPMLASAGVLTESQAYGKYAARGAAPGEALAGAAGEGAVEVATEAIPMGFLVKQLGRVGAGQFLAGLLAREVPSEQLATLVQDAIDTAVANPDKTWGEYADERGDAAYKTLVATLTQAGVVQGAHIAVRTVLERERQAQAAEQGAQSLQRLAEMVKASKVAQRDPAAFQAFVDEAAKDGPVHDIYVEGRVLAETLEQAGIPLDQFAATSPAAAAQVIEAATTGGDVRISLGEYAATIAATDLHAALLPHLKTDPAGMSQAEAQAFMQSASSEFQQQAEQVLATIEVETLQQQFAAKVESTILEQLTTANRFTGDVNKAYAALTREFYSTMSGRFGMTPEEMYAKYPLRVQAESLLPEGSLAQELAQIGEQRAAFADLTGPSSLRVRGRLDARLAELEILAQGEVARGQFNPATNTIALLKNADLSTFLHESGHFYLEVLADLADRADSPVAADMQVVLDWFGIPELATWRRMTLEQKRSHHETFARGFEAYLFEGKAPSDELRGMFARFRSWLVNVYKSVAGFKVELSDEVRGVFNRLLASEEQIREAENAARFAPFFESAEAAGMTPDEWASYQALGAEATEGAAGDLERRSLRDMQWLANARSRALKSLQKESAAKRDAIEVEVAAEVRTQPMYAAQHFLKRGELLADGEAIKVEAGSKLSEAALEAMYPPGALGSAPWQQLARGRYGVVAKEGLHPDVVAEMFGFTSGDHLVRSLLEAPPEAEVVEGLTDQRMLERYGDLATPREIERAASQAVHNEARARFIAVELNALAKATGGRRVLVKAAKDLAAAIVARRRLRDIKPMQFVAAEARASQAAEAATRAGNLVRAAVEKRNQLINNYAARSAHDAVAEVDQGVRYLRRVSGSDSIDLDYRDQINALLARFDLRGLTNKEADRRKALAKWIESQHEQGLEPVIDERIADEAFRKPYREMSLEEFRGLVDAVRNIEHLGRLKKRLLTAAAEREFAEAAESAAASIAANSKGRLPARIEQNQWRDRARKGLNEFFAWHRKLSSLFREMDGFKDGGVMWELFSRPMNKAGDTEAALREQATVELGKVFAPILRAGNLRQKVYIPEIGKSLSREGRLMVALHWGNDGNRQRLLDGDGWTPAQVQAILDTLTKDEWDFVQAVWDHLDSYRPQVGEQQKRLTGLEPEWVNPTTVRTRFGGYRGGYMPAKYDTDRSSRSESDEAATDLMDRWRAVRGRATTRSSFTKGRVDKVVDRPLRKDFGVIFQHVSEVTHRLAWQDFLVDATRLLRAKPIDSAIREHYGPEVLRAIQRGIEDMAAGDVAAQNVFETAVNHLRQGATIAGLGWNVTTSLLQPLGLTQSIVRIGPKWVAKGLARWLGSAARMEGTVAWIHERSEFMRLRGKTMQREISEIRNRVSGTNSRIEASYFYLIQKLQLVADIPTWLGQYEKAMAEGVDEAKAIALADQAVLDSQGGGQIKDLAGVQRGGPLQKLWTNFYSFFNTTYNLAAEAKGRVRSLRDAPLLAVDYLLLFTVPAALGALLKAALKGEDDDLPEKLAREQMNYLLGTMVGLRELGAAVQGFYGYSGPAGLRFFSEINKLYRQAEDGEVDEALFKSMNNVGGILFHYPAGQVERTFEGGKALVEGDTDNPLAIVAGAPRSVKDRQSGSFPALSQAYAPQPQSDPR